jgi:hypothetical protein
MVMMMLQNSLASRAPLEPRTSPLDARTGARAYLARKWTRRSPAPPPLVYDDLYGCVMRTGVAPSPSHGAVVGDAILLPDTSTAALANANAAAALAPRLTLPLRNPITAPLAHPPSAPFHASLAPRASSAAHDTLTYAPPSAPNSAAPLAMAPAALTKAGNERARYTAGASEPHAARAHPTTAPNAEEPATAAVKRAKQSAPSVEASASSADMAACRSRLE